MVDEQTSVISDDDPSFERLFMAHHERVFMAAYRVSGSVHDAEDVLQSVFLRLLNRNECYSMGTDPANYLCRAAINASLDIVRTKRRKQVVDQDDGSDLIDSPGSTPDSHVQRVEQRNHLRAALLQLNPRSAEIFALRYFEDYTNNEIADMLETSSSVIAVTLHRTRDRLAKILREFEGREFEGGNP